MKAADFAIRHPSIIGIILISLALFGILSFQGMDRDLLANITTPEILVFTVLPGASPDVVERDVTEVLEKEFSLIEGIEGISSESHNGYSIIFISMSWEVDLDAKKNDIRDRINNVSSELPGNIRGNPQLFELGTSAVPVYTAVVESQLESGELAQLLEDDIIPRFSRITDVSAVYARGAESPAVRVVLDPAKMDSLGVTALESYAALAGGQASIPAGSLTAGGDLLTLLSDGAYTGLEQLTRQPVGYTSKGQAIFLEDVATVCMGSGNAEFRASSSGTKTVALDVMKRPGGDTDSLVAGVRDLEERITREYGGAIRFTTIMDDSRTISITLRSVSNSAWLGGLLAIFVLLLFLHDLRASLIVGLSIPFTVFLTFILMNLMGMTMNIMTLAGITVSIGMVVDSSIVILENTMRHRKLGLDSIRAASLGAHEVGGAVLASTSTSLSVFIPVLFVSGLAGAILSEVARVLIIALACSALTAIFIVPWLASHILEGERRFRALTRLGEKFDIVFDRFAALYTRFLSMALGHKTFILVLAVVLVAASAGVMGMLGGEMFSAPDMNEFEIYVKLPSGYTLEQSERKMSQVAALVRREVPEIEADLWYAGLGDSALIVDTGNPSAGYGRIRLERTSTRQRTVFEIISRLNRILPEEIPDAEFDVRNAGLAKLMNYATDGAGFRVEVSGSDWDDVLVASEIIRQVIAGDSLVDSTSTGVRLDREMMALDIDRTAASRLAVDPVSAGRNLRILFNGESAGNLNLEGRSLPIFVDSSLAGESLPDGILGRIGIRNAGGTVIPYSAFSSLERRDTTDRIPHRDRLPSVVVVGNLSENDLSGVRSRLEPRLNAAVLPSGVSWQVTGVADLLGETFRELARSLAIAIFLVYAVMVIQFERFTQPFVIMGAVPFVLIGVAISLAAFGSRITMMTFFGVIALGGMVVNNAIVLVEFANQRRQEGSSVRDAVLDAARIRLRPILITTLTTLLGLIPLAFAVGEGSEIYAPLGQVIGGGLVTSTLITLAIVPVLYEAVETRRARRSARRISRKKLNASGVSSSVMLLGVLLFTAFPGSNILGAGETGQAHAPYSLEDLTVIALAEDPELLAVREDARSAGEQLKGARAERGPRVDLELGTSYFSDPLMTVPAGSLGTFDFGAGPISLPAEDTDVLGQANDFRYDISVSLEQPLFTWGKISSGVDIADAGSRAAKWQVAGREDFIAAEVRIACESLVFIGRMRETVDEQQALGDRLSELTLSNFREGFLLETEYRDTRNRLQQILLTASSLEKQEQDILLTLMALTGLQDLEIDDLLLPEVSDDPDSYSLPDLQDLVYSAWNVNPDILALSSMEDLAQAELEYARGDAGIKPDIAFVTEFSYGGSYNSTPDNLFGTWQLTLGAQSTLFDSGRSRASIRSSEASSRAAAARTENGRRQTEVFISSSVHAMGLNRDNISYYTALRDADGARAEEKKSSWDEGYGREEEWLLAELDRLASELLRLREASTYLKLDRQVRSVAGILDYPGKAGGRAVP